MALFKRRAQPAPEWTPFTSGEEWGAFAAAVRSDAGRRGWTALPEDAIVLAGDTRYGLNNLAQACLREEPAAWPETVRRYFDALVALPLDGEFDTAEQARSVLKARLVDDAFLARVPSEPAARRVAEDLQLVLAYDMPHTVLIPSRDEVLAWGEEDELFEHALELTRVEPGLELRQSDVDGSPVSLLRGESFFTATHALWADELAPPASEHGSLVVAPTRNVILAHAIRDDSAIGMVVPLLQFAARFHREGPGSLSEGVYWARGGSLERLDAWIDEKGPHIAPSDGFAETLGRLRA